MELRSKFILNSLVALTVFGSILTNFASASVKQSAQKSRMAANYRSIVIAYHTYAHLGGVERHKADKLQTMEDLLRILAKVEMLDSSLFLSLTDQKEFKDNAPTITGYWKDDGTLVFIPEILKFPISFSFAVYPDLERPSNATPLLWTRGLHNYRSYDKPYSGSIAFLDGHVSSYSGHPGEHDPELEYWFGPKSEYPKAMRILEHKPPLWSDDPNIEPLPIRIYKDEQPTMAEKLFQEYGFILLAAISGLIAFSLPAKSINDRVGRAIVATLVVLIVLALIPSV